MIAGQAVAQVKVVLTAGTDMYNVMYMQVYSALGNGRHINL